MSHFNREQIITTFATAAAVVSVIGVIALAGLEAYVRWGLNKEFTFLGGGGLTGLAISSFGLLGVLAYNHRTK